jgi:peptide/nickel transport system ATP-binding protein
VFTVGAQVAEALRLHRGLTRADAWSGAVDLLRMVEIPDAERRARSYPHEMSGGMKQRVMIAMAISCEPALLIADEPTTALDVTIQAQILDLLKSLQKQQGMGMLLITHDLAVVSGMAHRVALMYAGQIVEVASAAEFFAAPRHPYARLLLRALPEAAKRGERLAAISGTVPALTQEFKGCRFAPRCDRVFDACHTTLPELVQADERSVRCLLYRDGGAIDEAPITHAAAAIEPASTRKENENPVPLLEVRGLTVKFPIRKGILQRAHGAFTAVDDVSFNIRAGETMALVGESGCGKTTTGKAIVQLLRGQAQLKGEVKFNGHDLFALEGRELRKARRSVQIIFQDPFASLNPRMRVLEILEEGQAALLPGLSARTRRANIDKLIDQVGLRKDSLERYPHEFSGGQRQRIAIARALAVKPDLIVCDEPTSALDVSVQAQILNLLRDLQRELGVSYLFITHNIGVVEYIADHVAVMQDGRIGESGVAEAVLRYPRSPYTKSLLAAVPRIGAIQTG